MRQVLPKHTLEALLVGLCGTVVGDDAQATDGWGEGPPGDGAGGSDSGRKSGQQQEAAPSCVWTELTTPVMTAALNLKPALSDHAIAALVRGVEAAAEQPKLQVRTAGIEGGGEGYALSLVFVRVVLTPSIPAVLQRRPRQRTAAFRRSNRGGE